MKKHFELMIFSCPSFISKQKNLPAAMLPVCVAGCSCKHIINLFRRFYFIVVLVLIKFCPCLCQQIIFNKVSPPLGSFTNYAIGSIAQDRNGYMWIATGEGLYRYDGYSFKRYVNNPSDRNSLSSTHLEGVYIDRDGMIWIFTWFNGLNRLDPETGKFTRFQHDPNDSGSLSDNAVRAILQDKEGVLWVGTHGGLDRYDPKTGKFQHYSHHENDSNSLSCNRVRALYEDKEGTLWVGTGSVFESEGGKTDEGGLNRFDKATGKFTRYLYNPNDPHSLINNKVRAIFEDSRGNFWVGTAGDGLHKMDRKTGTFERYRYDPAHPDKLSRPPVNAAATVPDHIGFITEDTLGNLWIGTVGNGLCRYDPKTQRNTYYNKDSSGFADQSGWSFCNSRDGILWIGSWEGGLYRVDPYHKNIPHISIPAAVLAVYEDPAVGLWLGTTQGLFLQESKTGDLKRFFYLPHDPNSLSSNRVHVLCRDKQGTLWIGTDSGLNRFVPRTNLTRYSNDPGDTNTIVTGPVYGIAEEGDDSLWIVTGFGIDLMNKRTGTFTHLKNKTREIYSPFGNDHIYINCILKDGSGNLLIGTEGGTGLDYFNPGTGKSSRFLKGLDIYSLLVASDGTIWVGTDAGVYQTTDVYKGFKKFTYPGSDEIQNVLSIQEDDQKKIWLSTSSGIFRIDPENDQINFYGANYGIKGGYLNSGFKGGDGRIYFGDANGYYVFSPAELTSNPTPPQIILTGFGLGGKPAAPGGKNDFTSSLENAKRISLRYNQNAFTISFASIHYSSPENNRHLYMLEPYDQSWHETGVERSASYFNIPPGSYTFHVKAASSDGVWAEKTILIIISPPWWRTWWAYVIYGLLLIAAIYGIDRFQRDRVIRAERERTREREFAQAKEIEKAYHELRTTQAQLIQSEKMASLGELTAGIAHEIQNPLNFVNNFSEVNREMIDELQTELKSGNVDEAINISNDIKNNEEKINHHGKRADAIVKGMLQHSRASSGQKEPTDINKLSDEYLRLSYHGMRARDKSFNAEFKTEFDETVGKINVVPQDIGRVLLNLFNNAFYAVNEKKKSYELSAMNYEPLVTVQTKKVNDKLEIRVSDNGNGIPQNIVDKIFQPFFTTKPTGQGTGLGLSLAYDIIKAHGGEIKVVTKEGEGSEFVIQLPMV
jgi:ligand-binding sensor domain-containing protein/signal transduction histidine kinase